MDKSKSKNVRNSKVSGNNSFDDFIIRVCIDLDSGNVIVKRLKLQSDGQEKSK